MPSTRRPLALPHTEDNKHTATYACRTSNSQHTAAGDELQSSYQQTTSCTTSTCFFSSLTLRSASRPSLFTLSQYFDPTIPLLRASSLNYSNISAGPATLSLQVSRKKSTDVSFFPGLKSVHLQPYDSSSNIPNHFPATILEPDSPLCLPDVH